MINEDELIEMDYKCIQEVRKKVKNGCGCDYINKYFINYSCDSFVRADSARSKKKMLNQQFLFDCVHSALFANANIHSECNYTPFALPRHTLYNNMDLSVKDSTAFKFDTWRLLKFYNCADTSQLLKLDSSQTYRKWSSKKYYTKPFYRSWDE